MNYKKLGLLVGLEVHYQLDTGKLFCRCPSILKDDKPDFKLKRYLHAVSSEFSEKDVVAEFEMAKRKYAIYEANNDNACLFEIDEEPCHPINKEALKVALQVSMLLNCKIVDRLEIMRKQVLNYSNTSGFQRSGLLAYDGYIETKSGKIGINALMIEEDAARKVRETKDYVVFKLDRLGIPLLEIATAAEIKIPEQAREVAKHIGMVVKSTGKNMSGIGSVRQDINISIKGGARVEIKGVQDLKSIPRVIEKEVLRQLKLIKKGKKVKEEVRKVNEDFTSSYLRPLPGAARMYPETDIPYIKVDEKELKIIKLPKLITEKVISLEKEYKISKDVAKELISLDFNAYVKKFRKIKPKIIAQVLIEIPKDIKKRHKLDVNKLRDKDFDFVLNALSKNEISKGAVPEVFIEIIKGKKPSLKKYKIISDKVLEKEIKKIVKKNKDASIKALMGIIMKKYKGRLDGKKVVRLLKKMVK